MSRTKHLLRYLHFINVWWSVELAGILIAPHESEGGLRLEAQRKQNAKTSVNTLDEELLRKKKQQLQTVVKAKVFSVNYSVFGNNDRLVIVGPCWAEEAGRQLCNNNKKVELNSNIVITIKELK